MYWKPYCSLYTIQKNQFLCSLRVTSGSHVVHYIKCGRTIFPFALRINIGSHIVY